MAFGRWYATATTLPDGTVLATSGLDEFNEIVLEPELYDPVLNQWSSLPQASLVAGIDEVDYPYMFVLPDGNLVNAGPADTRLLLSPGFTWGALVDDPANSPRPGYHGSAAMFAPGRIVRCGGEPQGNASTWVLDLSSYDPQSPPSWLAASSMNIPRQNHNLVVLPDGTVLAVGGCASDFDTNPVLQPEIFNPAGNTWTLQPTMDPLRPRPYHSTAILLPDGRVVVGGGFSSSAFSGQIFKPPYIIDSTNRPVIIGAPTTMEYGLQPYDIQYLINGGKTVTAACLMRLGSVTHGFDQDQRRVPLTIGASTTISGDLRQVTVKSPDNGNIAPPGYYMLFIMYEREVNEWAPCEMAAYVRVGS